MPAHKKISLLSSFDQTTGGQAINAAIFSCKFSERGYEVLNICYDTEHINMALCGKVESLHIPFIKKIRNPVLNVLAKPIQCTVAVMGMRRLFHSEDRQKVICFGWGACLIALVSKKLFAMKNMDVVCRVGTRFEEEFRAEKSVVKKLMLILANALIKFFYKDAFIVSPISTHLQEFLIEDYGVAPQKIKVLYNPRDEEQVQALARQELETPLPGGPIIITCGRLAIPKGQGHLLRAFSLVRKEIPCKLVIVGDGNLREYLQKLAKDLNVEHDVVFLGWQENPFKYFSRSDLFVLNSLWEGFANVILEAMICGLPIISSDCYSGPRELLAPATDLNRSTQDAERAEYGILVPTDDGNLYEAQDPFTASEKIVAHAMLDMLKSPDLKNTYKNQSLKRAADFNIKKVIDEWIAVLETDHGKN